MVRRGATLVTGPLEPEVEELAAQTGATVVPAPPVEAGPAGYQRANFAAAVAAARALHGELDPALVAEVAARVRVPGRMQVVGEDPLTIYDGAHNPSGMRALADALDVGGPLIAVVSILDDKDAAGMLRALLGKSVGAVFTQLAATRARCRPPRSPRWPSSSAGRRRRSCPIRAPRWRGRASWPARTEPSLATGSIYLVADLLGEPGRRRASAL